MQSDHAPKKSFLLFASIFEASMVDAKLSKKSVQFEISIGKSSDFIANRPLVECKISQTPSPHLQASTVTSSTVGRPLRPLFPT